MKPEGGRRCWTIRVSFEPVEEGVGELGSRRAVLFVGPAHYNPEGIIWQRALQCFGFIPHDARIHTSRSSSVVRITGMAFGWIASTAAFGDVVRKP
jgi:hypothetical protein